MDAPEPSNGETPAATAAPPPPVIAPPAAVDEVVRALAELRHVTNEMDRQLTRGMFFGYAVMTQVSDRLNRVESMFTGMFSALAAKGIVDSDDIMAALRSAEAEQEAEAAAAAHGAPAPGDHDDHPSSNGAPDASAGLLREREQATPEPEVLSLDEDLPWPSLALREDDDLLPDPTVGEVDCDARMHICQAVCCKLSFPLSGEDVEAGRVKWELGRPYLIRHDADGYCSHNDKATRGCTIYDDRPMVCRRYNCTHDTRIWKDFAAMELNREWLDAHVSPNAFPLRIRVEARMDEVPVPSPTRREPASG